MSEITQIIDELKAIHAGDAWHGSSLKEALTNVTPQQATARPVDDAHSIWELVLHIKAWENVWRIRLKGHQATEPEEGDFPPVKEVNEQSWAHSLAELDAGHNSLIGVIAELSDSALEDTVVGTEYSVRFMLRGLIRHHVYHAGQIALLKKAGSN